MGVVGLIGAGGGAALGDGGFEGGFHGGNAVGVVGDEVLGFTGVGFEVVELEVGQAGGVVFAGAWGAPAAGAGAEGEFPFAVADGEAAVDGLADEAGADGLGVGAEEGGEEADAVFAGGGGEGDFEEVGEGVDEVELADELVADGSGFHFGGPAGDEGDAMAAFVEVGFVAAVDVAGVVIGGEEFVDVCSGGAAVVGGEDDEGVFGDAVLFEG